MTVNTKESSAALSSAEYARRMENYAREGMKRAKRLGNRGPVRFHSHGKLHPDIVDAYWDHGFYIFKNVLRENEVNELRRDVIDLLKHAPVGPRDETDSFGNVARGIGMKRYPYSFVRPLSDPVGGTAASHGRHESKMTEVVPPQNAPNYVVQIIAGMCELFESGLRIYGHPHLLAVAEAMNGSDFVPYNDAIFVKQPGLGGSVAWHQDGVTHWDSTDWDEGIHGLNFQAQLNRTTALSCLWVVPGTHKLGKVDIKAMVAANDESDQLPNAVPLYCEPGDVTIVNRQTLHSSFANASEDFRISVSWGMHRRSAVAGQHGHLMQPREVVYDDDFIDRRASVIQVAIDARRQYYPDETSYVYQPFKDSEDQYRWTLETFESVIRDYNTRDIAI